MGSDITYWKIETGFLYISLITDAFPHKIVGYQLSKTLEAEACVKALEMALTQACRYLLKNLFIIQTGKYNIAVVSM